MITKKQRETRVNIVITVVTFYQAPVVQMVDSATQWINHYPLDNAISLISSYPLDSDLSSG